MPDEMEAGLAHEMFISCDDAGVLRILAKDPNEPRVFDLTDEIFEQFFKKHIAAIRDGRG